MNDISLLFVKIVITILGTLLTVYIIPLLKTQLENNRYVYILQIVDTAVRAAEQTMQKNNSGAFKKKMVTEFVTKWLNERNIKISEEQLSEIIEWAVFTMKAEVEDGN